MNKIENKIKASELRMIILKKYKELWEKNPQKNAFIEDKDYLYPIWESITDKTTAEFREAVITSLRQDRLIESRKVPNPQGELVILSRITDEGLDFLSENKEKNQTRIIAILGAINGTAGLIIAIIKIFLG